MTINQDIYDRKIDHLIRAKRYGKEAEQLIQNAGARHRNRLTGIVNSSTTKDIQGQLPLEVSKFTQEVYEIGRSSLSDFTGAEIDFQSNNLRRSVEEFYTVRAPNRKAVADQILKDRLRFKDGSMSAGGFKHSMDSIGKRELLKAEQIVRRGIADGRSQKELVAELLRNAEITERQATTLVQTTFTQSESTILQKVVEENSELIDRFMFSAILDSRTSSVCSTLHGTIMASDKVIHKPPIHWNCRSTLTPLIRPMKELAEVDSPRIKKTKLPVEEGGEPPLPENFDQWLSRQTMDVKLKHLGDEERVALFEKGNLSFNQFFAKNMKPITLSQLRIQDRASSFLRPILQKGRPDFEDMIPVSRPHNLSQSKKNREALRRMLIDDSITTNQPLSLVDYRGTTIAGKRGVRARSQNVFDDRVEFDPLTGETRSSLYYDPDFNVLQERIDFMKNSKTLTAEQKTFIGDFVNEMEESISVNQQSAVTEALRVTFERYNKDKVPWDDFPTVLRNEMRYSVVNTSRILDRRSRARSEQFLGFTPMGDDPKVQILGKYVSFDDLSKRMVSNRDFIDNWSESTGRNLARRLYFTGNAPARTYILPPRKPTDIPYNWKEAKKLFDKKLKKWAEDTIPGVKQWNEYQKYKYGPQVFFDRVRNEAYAKYRRIIDLQWTYNKDRRSFSDKVITATVGGADEEVDKFSRMLKIIAEGESTDYDTIAIKIGEDIRKSWAYRLPFFKPDLQDYHSDGTRILEGLRRQGIIRVQSRGVVKRGVIDLDTNRPSGPMRDTVSREVTLIDDDLLELQRRSRELDIGTRIGVIHDSQKLYVRPGQKTYFDPYDKDTKIPIITRSAFADFDPLQIDRDFAGMLNHTMSNKYVVDKEFSSFFIDLAKFRDVRGNSEYYDDLNKFRQVIIKRGDQGYGLLETIKWHTQRGKPFGNYARIDSRGRVYYRGYLTPTGGEVVRPFIDSAHATSMTPGGVKQIQTSLGVIFGPADEAMTNAGRLTIFKRHEDQLLKIGQIMSSTTQRDRRIREFLTNPLIMELDDDEVSKVARYALEYYRIHKHTGGNLDDIKLLSSYKSRLMTEADASASALQMISLSTGNVKSALTSNVLPTRSKGRIYDLVIVLPSINWVNCWELSNETISSQDS